MITKVKRTALTLGLLTLLVVPAQAQNPIDGPAGGKARPDHPVLMFAGGSSLITDNREALPENIPPSPGPNLIVTEPRFDFDRVLEGETVEHDFLIANRGRGPLAIHQVRTG